MITDLNFTDSSHRETVQILLHVNILASGRLLFALHSATYPFLYCLLQQTADLIKNQRDQSGDWRRAAR